MESKPTESGSLEYPAKLHARGRAPVNAVVERLTPTACRLRSVLLFDVGAKLAFDFGEGPGGVHLSGKIAERIGNGPRFTYRMDLDESPDGGEALLSAVAQWHRNRASRAVDGPEAPAPDALKRAQTRVSTQFPVAYATRAGEECADGRAADLSTGGLSLSCKEPLGEGRLLLLRFTLPSDAVESMEGDAIARRPFAEMQLSARVVWRRAVGPGLFTYGLVFFEIDAGTRAEINRYVEAVRAVTSPARRPPA